VESLGTQRCGNSGIEVFNGKHGKNYISGGDVTTTSIPLNKMACRTGEVIMVERQKHVFS
jgi:hypothetical protein